MPFFLILHLLTLANKTWRKCWDTNSLVIVSSVFWLPRISRNFCQHLGHSAAAEVPAQDHTPVPKTVMGMSYLSQVVTENNCRVIWSTWNVLTVKNHVYIYFREGVVARMSREGEFDYVLVRVLQRNRACKSIRIYCYWEWEIERYGRKKMF